MLDGAAPVSTRAAQKHTADCARKIARCCCKAIGLLPTGTVWSEMPEMRERVDWMPRYQRRCAVLRAHIHASPEDDDVHGRKRGVVTPAEAASFASGVVTGLIGGAAAAAVYTRFSRSQQRQHIGLEHEVPQDGTIPQPSTETFGVPMGPAGEIHQTPVSIPRVGQSAGAYSYTRAMLDDGIHNTRTLGHSTKLEESFSARFGHKYGILYANGTATLHGALLGCGVGVGDEVIVPSFTPFPTGAAVLYCNAVPVVVDVDPDTWTIDPSAVAAAITPRTKAIIPVRPPVSYATYARYKPLSSLNCTWY